MKTSDVPLKTLKFADRTSRVTDVLNPTYEANGMIFQDDKYMRPRKPKPFVESHFMQTRDVNNYMPEQGSSFPRREYRNTNYIGDIDGACSDTIKHSIVTNRQSNPLAPVYQALDPGELLLPLIPPLLPPSMIKVPTIRAGQQPKAHSAQGMELYADLGRTGASALDDDPMALFANSNTLPVDRKYAQGGFSLSLPPSEINFGGANSNKSTGRLGQSGFSSGRFNGLSQPSSRNSPAISARSLSGTATATQRKASRERMDEINLVRQLQNK